RFLSVDRLPGILSRPQRLNRYVYTRNDPINRTDRVGLNDEDDEDDDDDDDYGEVIEYYPPWLPDYYDVPGVIYEPEERQPPIVRAPWMDRLIRALRHIGTRCTNFFGGVSTIEGRIKE